MTTNPEEAALQNDIAAVQKIPSVPTILDVVCRATGMGFAAVARVTEQRWIACGVKDEISFGLKPGDELEIQTTICNEIRGHRQPVVIDEVAGDASYRTHHTPAKYGFQSYISMPIVLPNGEFFGTLCAIDPRPARVNTPEIVGMFRLFAELIAFHLDTNRRLAMSEAALRDERETAHLREQFIAVLGHDLRNPLGSISSAAHVLTRIELPEAAHKMVGIMQKSVRRMAGLIDDVLDFARGRLGGGLSLTLSADEPLAPALEQVIAELRMSFPDRLIETDFTAEDCVNCDRARIAQLLSNLVANALTYSAPRTAVRAHTRLADGVFELSVSNHGDPIPPEAMARLFAPFERGAVRPSQQGLGLGLYIASEIARAHGGALTVTSTTEETRFTLKIPT
ncbi:MAG TPA: GAF domain-containing sensor histidine kinase [Steroidobacteraceae bacterium]|nr:GAF domain-containing sensor histidine kinase [Steroidobacteraceae bacterium]